MYDSDFQAPLKLPHIAPDSGRMPTDTREPTAHMIRPFLHETKTHAEITAIPALLDLLTVKETIVTIDAMGVPKRDILGFLGKPSIRFRAKHALSEADAPFARMKRSGPEGARV